MKGRVARRIANYREWKAQPITNGSIIGYMKGCVAISLMIYAGIYIWYTWDDLKAKVEKLWKKDQAERREEFI